MRAVPPDPGPSSPLTPASPNPWTLSLTDAGQLQQTAVVRAVLALLQAPRQRLVVQLLQALQVLLVAALLLTLLAIQGPLAPRVRAPAARAQPLRQLPVYEPCRVRLFTEVAAQVATQQIALLGQREGKTISPCML